MYSKVLLLSAMLFSFFVLSPIKATEPLGMDDFFAEQDLRQKSLFPPAYTLFGNSAAFDPELQTNANSTMELDDELAQVLNAPRAPRTGHEIGEYSKDQEEVLRYLFINDYWNKPNHPKRTLHKQIPADLLIKLRLCKVNPGQRANVLKKAYDAELVRLKRDPAQDRQAMSNFLGILENKEWGKYKDGVFKKLLPKGIYALEILEQEAASGRAQENLKVQRAIVKVVKKAALNEDDKALNKIRKPEYYLFIMQTFRKEKNVTIDSIRATINNDEKLDKKYKRKVTKHIETFIGIAIKAGWITYDEKTKLYTASERTDNIISKLESLKTKLANPEQQDAADALPEVNLKNIREPLMHFLVLKVASNKQDFISHQQFRNGIKAAYKFYTGEEIPDSKLRNVAEYTKKQGNDYRWLVIKKNGVSLEYKAKQEAIDQYLDQLENLAKKYFKPDLAQKRPHESQINDMEVISTADVIEQVNLKKAKTDIDNKQ